MTNEGTATTAVEEVQPVAEVKVKKEKKEKVEVAPVVTGTKNEAGDVLVNKADVIKIKGTKAETYGTKPFNHIAKLPNGKGIVFVWDTREIVGVVELESIVAEDINKNVRDTGSPLKITENTPADAIAAL